MRPLLLLAFLGPLAGCSFTYFSCPQGLGQGCTAWGWRLLSKTDLQIRDEDGRTLTSSGDPEAEALRELAAPGVVRPEPKPGRKGRR